MVGPTIIGNNVTVEQGAVVNSSIIGSNVSVAQGQVVSNRIVKTAEYYSKGMMLSADSSSRRINYKAGLFCKQVCRTSFAVGQDFPMQDALREWPILLFLWQH